MGAAQAAIMGVGRALAAESGRRRFVLYNGLLHRGRPLSLGLTPCNIVYGHKFFPGKADRQKLPSALLVKALGEEFRRNGHFTSLDLEAYHNNPNQMEYYKIITQNFRSTYGPGLLSHYGVLPSWITGPKLMAGKGSRAYRNWQKQSDRWFEVLGSYVNVFSPAQYVYGPDQDLWERRLRAYAEESRRLNPKTRFVPYIWFDFHQFAGKRLAGTPIPHRFWRRQLDILYEVADGAIVWGGYMKRWDPSADWWRETQDFMSKRL